ncbi:MAG: PilZ domain-containing protein [Terriglobales bacterium]
MENRRRNNRTKAVLPVRVSGSDGSGASYCDLAHTLDITESGIRLGFVRRQLKVGSRLTIQYRQHKVECRVIWVSQLTRLKEHHVGLEALVPRDVWGLGPDSRSRLQPEPPERASADIGV